MSEYQGCENCKYTNVDKNKYPCDTCTHNMPTYTDNYKQMTNADRIRNMTDEELAIIIMCPYDGTKEVECFMEGRNCIQCCKEWLQAEVKEGNSNENT